MKLLKIYKELTEGKQVGTVYHFTSIPRLKKILAANKLRYSHGKGVNIQKAVSTTRVSHTFDHEHNLGGGEQDPFVALMLDGDKLSNQYKTRPHDDGAVFASTDQDEAEQVWLGVLISRDKGIERLDRYLKGILLSNYFFAYSWRDPGKTLSLIAKVAGDIPIYLPRTMKKANRELALQYIPSAKII